MIPAPAFLPIKYGSATIMTVPKILIAIACSNGNISATAAYNTPQYTKTEKLFIPKRTDRVITAINGFVGIRFFNDSGEISVL